MTEEERRKKVLELLGRGAPTVSSPIAGVLPPSIDTSMPIAPYPAVQAMPQGPAPGSVEEAQARQLEAQSAPPLPPRGVKENLVSGIRAGLEGFAGGYTGGPGYFERQQARDVMERQREQDLLSRAKELRGEGLAKQTLAMNQANIAEDNRRQAAQAALEEKLKTAPKFENVPPGGTMMRVDPMSGQATPQFQAAPTPRNIDPNSPEGIQAEVAKQQALSQIPARIPAESQPMTPERFAQEQQLRQIGNQQRSLASLNQLDPQAAARVQAVAQKVATGEFTISQGQAALGGVRGGLGGALTEALDQTRVLPTQVRQANTDIERAKNLLIPVHQLVADINQTPDLATKAKKSLQLENYVQAIGTQFARAKGERGVVTDRDVSRVLGLIPGWKSANFAPAYAEENLKLVEDAFARDQQALLGQYFTKFSTTGGAATPTPAAPAQGGKRVVRFEDLPK